MSNICIKPRIGLQVFINRVCPDSDGEGGCPMSNGACFSVDGTDQNWGLSNGQIEAGSILVITLHR